MPSYSELATRFLGIENGLGSGVSNDEIVAAERRLGVPIEGGYRQFLGQFGCGWIGHFEIFGLGGAAHLDLVRVTLSERSDMMPNLPKHLLPVMNDGGGNLSCLETKIRGEPPVVRWYHSDGEDQVPEVDGDDFVSWLWARLDALD